MSGWRITKEGVEAILRWDHARNVFRLGDKSDREPAERHFFIADLDSILKQLAAETPSRLSPDALLDALKSLGYTIEIVSDDVTTIRVELDLKSLATASRTEPVQGGREVSDELQRRVAEIAGGALRKAILDGSLEGARQAISHGDLEAFAKALPRRLSNEVTVEDLLEVVEQALRVDPWRAESGNLLLVAAQTLDQCGEPERARELALRAASRAKELGQLDLQANSYLLIGGSWARKGELQPAREAFEAATRMSETTSPSTRAWAHQNLGTVCAQQGAAEEAEQHLRRAARIRTENGGKGEPARTLATAAARLEHCDARRARALWVEARAHAADPPTSNLERRFIAEVEVRIAHLDFEDFKSYAEVVERTEVAIPLLRELHECKDKCASAMALRAYSLQALGREAEAQEALRDREAFLQANPGIPAAKVAQALLGNGAPEGHLARLAVALQEKIPEFSELDEFETMGAVAEILALLNPHDQDERAIRAQVLEAAATASWKAGRASAAISLQQRASAERPSSLEHRVRLGNLLYQAQQYVEAMGIGRSLVKMRPDSNQGFLLCAATAYKMADYAVAEHMLKEALKRLPEDERASAMLARVQEELALHPAAMSALPALPAVPTNHATFLAYLQEFARRVEQNTEAFWKSRSKRVWTQNPEEVGRGLLVQDVLMMPAAQVYKEALIGGGRIDLTVNVAGTEFIVELKMCGGSYSTSYAVGGFAQLASYMSQRRATRSYLVVFDGRVGQGGESAIPSQVDLGDGRLAFCVCINVLGVDAVR